MKQKIRILAALIVVSALLVNCGWNHMARGGAIGAGIGGVLGGVIGHQAGNTAVGAIVGAAVGGATGAAIGRYMDKQVAEMRRDLKDARIERVGEGIKITFNSGILYGVNSDILRSTAKTNVNELARILQKYKDTNILVEGHTDSTGSARYNLTLSESRAESVSRQLKSQGVTGSRISTLGYGEDQPIENNGSSLGRQQNRRVEIAIFANDKLKRAAQRGEI
jgi:outer membrane protein OmpA-like peptidoglycan-associated protein